MKRPDHLSRRGAQELALRLQKYWADRGWIVEARVRIVPDQYRELAYIVETDMINGKPRRRANNFSGVESCE